MSPRAAIITQVAALRAQVDALAALAEALPAEHADDSRTLTLKDAAELSGLSAHTMRSWARSGRLRTFRGARGAYLCRRADLDAAIEATPSTPRPRVTPQRDDLEAWDAAANATLRLVEGGR